MRRILNHKEVFSILTCFLPTTLVPSTFVALCKLKTPPEKFVEKLCRNEENKIINQILQEERALLRNEKKRPWSIRTRRPFRGVVDAVNPTFKQKLELAVKVVKILGLPKIEEKITNRGRKPAFDLEKTIPVIIAKGMLSFAKLSKELKDINYDATIDGSGRSPEKSRLHEIFQLVSSDYLQTATKLLDDMTKELYSKFDEPIDIFVGDNSALTCETLIERMIGMETKLVRETKHFFALPRILTNTIRYVGNPTNKIKDIMSYLPPHSTLLLDREFDVDENYWEGIENRTDIHIRQKNTGRVRLPGRKRGKRMFDRKKYRRRKLGERPFGNIEKRRVRCYYRSDESRLKGAILIVIEHNIIEWYKAKAWCDQFVELRKRNHT
ncbi:MAG: hypothetical protein QME68_07250 [Elusimicrobiota bacterium]|nr:hypothetical protein [Elusimicrobiota bacterium]